MSLQRISCIFSLLLLTLSLQAQNQNDIVDITSRFHGCWGESESVTHNADGSLTYISSKWGGLSLWLGGEDWSEYSQLVFELDSPSPCVVQPMVQYSDSQWDHHYMNAGTQKAFIELDYARRNNIFQVALQTNAPATLVIRRVYLLKEQLPDYGEQRGQLIINELMQSNIDCVMDDLNDFPDSWVELYNSGTNPVNLAKYKIGLTADVASAWQLPVRTLNAGEYVLICCDKVGKGLHTSFRLDSGKGAAAYLFFEGEVDDKVTGLKKQPAPNIAYGRITDGSIEWGYQYKPTPGSANCGQLCSEILGEPVFSQTGRVVADAQSFSLTLSLPAGTPDGTVIRYTIDGSEPTAQSPQYVSPITVNTTRTVRAKLFCDGYLSPRSTTHSYLFMQRTPSLPVISLVTDDRYWYDQKIGIIVNNSSSNRNDWRRPVNIEYFEGVGTKSKLNQLCETRVQGGGSRDNKLKSLAVYANKRFGTKRLEYQFFPDQRPGIKDFKSVSLRNGGNDYPYLYLRDAIMQRTMSSHVDLDWQAWRPAIVFKNGVYKGMLNIRERSNEDNIYTNYDGLEDIDMIENWGELKEGDWTNYNQFKSFYSQAGHTLAEYEKWMDCTEFVNLMLTHTYYNNQDFPGNNIVMWRPRTAEGRWRFILKDTDFGMGLYGKSPEYKTIEWLYNPNYDSSCVWANRPEHTLLFRQLMEDADFKRMFIDRAAVYMGDFMNERGTRAFLEPMIQQISSEMEYHKAVNDRWVDFAEECNNVRAWLPKRTNSFYQQLADFYKLGNPVTLTVNTQFDAASLAGIRVNINDIPLSEGFFIGKFFVGRQVTLRGETIEGKQVTGWNIVQVGDNGSIQNSHINGPLYSFVMPQCSAMIVNAVIEPTGISDLMDTARYSYSWQGNQLILSNIKSGTAVSLYDTRGIMLNQVVSDGESISLPVKDHGLYILKVGRESIKLSN